MDFMKKRFNILFLCLCLTLSFGIILLASSRLTYASNVKDNKKAKGDRSKKKNKKNIFSIILDVLQSVVNLLSQIFKVFKLT